MTQRQTDHHRIVRRVGWVMIAVGVLDLAGMLYAGYAGTPYASAFNIFALLGGVLLLLGDISTVRKVTWFVGLWLTVAIGVLVIVPAMQPWALVVASFRAQPLGVAWAWLYRLTALALLLWIYLSLRRDPVLDARRAAGIKTARPLVAFGLGGLLVAALVTAEYALNHGDDAAAAKSRARRLHGEEYRYHVVRMQFADGRATAQLKAYDVDEVVPVEVQWREPSAQRPAE